MPTINDHRPKRAVLYARVSTDEQARSGYSLAQQIEALWEYATREGYEVLKEVQHPGQSGASLERPGMDRVRDLVAAGGVSVVLAQNRDHFAREPAYHYLLKREFDEHGTKIRALNDRGDDFPEGDLTDGILDQLAKYERAKMAERSRRRKLRKVRGGKVIAGCMARHGAVRYGFVFNEARDALTMDEEKMEVVRRIFSHGRGRRATHLRGQTDARCGGYPDGHGEAEVVAVYAQGHHLQRRLPAPFLRGSQDARLAGGGGTPGTGTELRSLAVGYSSSRPDAGLRGRPRRETGL
jgi:DNA invertase Pin-like site-specific DNA recombinase